MTDEGYPPEGKETPPLLYLSEIPTEEDRQQKSVDQIYRVKKESIFSPSQQGMRLFVLEWTRIFRNR